MNESFLSFDSVRTRVGGVLGGFTLPAQAPDVYLVRNLFGRVRLAATEKAESDDALSAALEELGRKLGDSLGVYGYRDQVAVLWLAESLVDNFRDARRELLPGVYWVDRLLTGGGWWTVGDRCPDRYPARYALYSVKGGVGRSTTAAVLARHLAARMNSDVLVLDMDLEAPGLASAVLPLENQPTHGVTDWFVEDLVGQGDRVLEDMTATPLWARDLSGNVWIVPAHGRDPGEFLAKLGRTYVDTAVERWPKRLNRLVTSLEEALKPTVVLIESRSGLHDIAAATVTDLDAEVLLFGIDSPSTWADYAILFDHWKRQGLAARIRDRLSIVSALTPELGGVEYLKRFRERAWDLFRDRLYDDLSCTECDTVDAVSHDLESSEAAHNPLVIRWDRGLAGGTDLRRFEESAVRQAYSPFLRSFDDRFGNDVRFGTPSVAVSTVNDTKRSDIETCRIALSELPEGTRHGDQIPPEHVYFPPSHRKALSPNVSLVTGIRGSGKTFWWSALQEPAVQRLLEVGGSIKAIGPKGHVRAGFGVPESPRDYPTRIDLATLIGAGVDPRLIWRAVHARHMAASIHPLANLDSWDTRVRYVQQNTNAVVDLFRDRDASLEAEHAYSLVLFDGLDRTADRWEDTFKLIRGLVQHALDMRSYRRLRVKIFLRADQVDEERIADFPDASKILADAAELTWPPRDLYGMLWHYLANGRDGETLRKLLTPGDWPHVELDGGKVYGVPAPLASDKDYQRERFHEFTGPWMGTDRRRGFPYTWIPNHLADAAGCVSPRSFLKALRVAATETAEHHRGHEYALHYDSIKRGVREASRIRMHELREDHPWVHRLLASLSGVVVPCRFAEVEKTWMAMRTIGKLEADVQKNAVKLPPRGIAEGCRGIRLDLEALGVFRRLHDGRVDIPDVFRLGYGIGRKGGVRPAK